ncbi:MAG: bifunctional 2-C-methyl-D-erythritol 4-phosphate cytidylyltransferase/2-C-methyl-D-erythritol 2,4-cyclodiphosphate synthase [Pseudomonadota bacterium]
MSIAALVVAAGRGIRAGGDGPKQYRHIGGEPMLTRTLRALLNHPAVTLVQPVIHPTDGALYEEASAWIVDQRLHSPVFGGETRQASVRAGLDALISHNPEKVLIHDGARPFPGTALIERVISAVAPGRAAFPALPVVDTLWRTRDAVVQTDSKRDGLWRAQTPQGFRFAEIHAAHAAADPQATDDIAVIRTAGHQAHVVMGDETNFKITTPADFTRAETHLRSIMDVRTGNGFDVHAFAPGNSVTLCGITVPHDRSLKGHSDADVGLHSLTDAIFGALAEGDIGQWFPPSDPEWKGAASHIFLEKAVERAAARGFRISHLDCTLICETPKIGPHAEAMRAEVARITRVDPGRISIKATTSERLGFTGRGEGIAAMATATLVSG